MDHLANLDVRNLAIARRSAAPRPWAITHVEELSRQDLILLVAPHAAADPRAPLARISAPHHMLAKMVAEGKTDVEVSAVTGYRPERVATLRRDPAFAELVNHYEGEHVSAGPNIQAQVQHIALTAGQLLQEKLEDPEANFTLKELQGLWSQGLDRIGHGPSSKVTHDINDPSGVINNLRTLITAENKGKILSRGAIDAEFTEVPPNDPAAQSERPDASVNGTSGPVSGAETPAGQSSGGDSVPEPGSPAA